MPVIFIAMLGLAGFILLGATNAAAADGPAAMANPVRLAPDGWFHLRDGGTFVPLGGFHGNMMPLSMLNVTEEQQEKFKPYLWHNMLDLCDAPDAVLDEWFRMLADAGVTAVRLFPRARVGSDVLDLCGKVNPELQAAFHRAFAAAKPYHIRFLLQIMPEPGRTGYRNNRAIKKDVLPRYTAQDLASLTEAQKRFLVDGKTVNSEEYFSDPDVLACQKLYLQRVLEWVASEEQIFALEIYNEQGWDGSQIDGKWQQTFSYGWEKQEIQWTAELVAEIKKRLPEMPVCVSHPGFGVTGFDPLPWAKGAKVDFYSTHMYAGLCGEGADIDFPAATGATAAIIAAGAVNFNGEWGILTHELPQDLHRRNHSQAIWLALMAGSPGFMQWEYDYPEEYRWPARILASLPEGFAPQRPAVAVEIGQAYRQLHDNQRYPLFRQDGPFPAFPFNKQKQADENLRRLFAAYQHSLEIGLPIRFVMGEKGALSLEQFNSLDVAKYPRPIQAIGGYQAAYVKDRNSETWLAFLRGTSTQNVKNFFLATPVERPLELKLDLPAGQYTLRLVNLQTGESRQQNVGGSDTVKVSDRTSDDYAAVISRQ